MCKIARKDEIIDFLVFSTHVFRPTLRLALTFSCRQYLRGVLWFAMRASLTADRRATPASERKQTV